MCYYSDAFLYQRRDETTVLVRRALPSCRGIYFATMGAQIPSLSSQGKTFRRVSFRENYSPLTSFKDYEYYQPRVLY